MPWRWYSLWFCPVSLFLDIPPCKQAILQVSATLALVSSAFIPPFPLGILFPELWAQRKIFHIYMLLLTLYHSKEESKWEKGMHCLFLYICFFHIQYTFIDKTITNLLLRNGWYFKMHFAFRLLEEVQCTLTKSPIFLLLPHPHKVEGH